MKERHQQASLVRDPGPVGDECPTDDDHNLRELSVLEALYHQAGLQAEEDPAPPTAEERKDIDTLGVFVEQLVKTRPGSRRR